MPFALVHGEPVTQLPRDLYIPPQALEVILEAFEGPLDLLLHLIQQHEIDILNIPVSFITEKYLAYLQIMRTLSIDIASEYLVMAATLVHIKSKMLLPSVPAGQEDDSVLGEEEEDPRAELVRRLLEYQKYKAAAAELGERGTLGKDVFMRGVQEAVPEGPAPFAPMGVFSLLDAFEKILKRTKVKLDHEVVFDRISITDRIVELTEKLQERRTMRFEDLLLVGTSGGTLTRFDLVITFLAVLEMARLKLLKVYQSGPLEPIHLQYGDGPPPNFDEEEEKSEAEASSAPEEVEAAVPEAPETPSVEEPAVPEAPETPSVGEPAAPEAPETPLVGEPAAPEAPEALFENETGVPEPLETPSAEETAAPEPLETTSAEETPAPEPSETPSAEETAAPEPPETPFENETGVPEPPETPPAEETAAPELGETAPQDEIEPGEPDGG
ncbi:MAG: segregation/condensation protein A [Polyangiaceae bacterium]|nr:segregation/condensation protein A [Polyangiaceae bacterium]